MASRSRSRKPRLTRMDAAIDAMMQYGFSEDLVRTQVKELLKAYGGDDGWIFIEDSAYKELLEAILRRTEPNKQEENAEKGRSLENDSLQDRNVEAHVLPDAHGPSNAVVVADAEHLNSTDVNNVPEIGGNTAEEDGKGWKDIELDQVSGQKETTNVVSNIVGASPAEALPRKNPTCLSSPSIPSPLPANSQQTCRRRPCCGWIDNNGVNDSDQFIVLPAAPRLAPARSRKRKSRWDLRPEDP